MASAQILADQVGAELKVVWAPQDAAPAQARMVFDSALIDRVLHLRGKMSANLRVSPRRDSSVSQHECN